MKKIFPIITMLWPYITLLLLMLEVEGFLYIELALFVINLAGAILYSNDEDCLHWNKIIKLVHIPYYVLTFIVGVLFALLTFTPVVIMIFVGPSVVLMLFISDVILMLSTSLYGLINIFRSKGSGYYIWAVLHFFFVLDVVGACAARSKEKALAIKENKN